MAGTAPRLPEQFRSASQHAIDFNVSELVSSAPGAHSPFGDDIDLPLPHAKLDYDHPTGAERPYLAEGR